MENMNFNLNESPVVFDAEHHTYNLNGHELSGVTPIIAWLFPDTYKGIPQSVLDAAADYGTLIHEKCELLDSMGIMDKECNQVYHYSQLIANAGLTVAMSEYLVSDEHYVASKIDKVFTNSDIGDIKTTSKVHLVNVQVQLSIYAWLYELQNPGKKVGKLWLIWLPKEQYGEPELREIPRIPADVCEYVVEVYGNGGDPLDAMSALVKHLAFEPERKRVEGEVPEGYESFKKVTKVAESLTYKVL